MISEKKLKFIIDSIKDIPGWMNRIRSCFGERAEHYAEEYIDDKERCIKDAEKYYYSQELPKVREQIKEFKKEEEEFAKECRDRIKKELQESLDKKCKVLEKKLEHFGNIEEKKVLYEEIEKLNKRLNSDISEEDIEMARNADCAQFVDVKKRVNGKAWALCPYHKDTNPSLCCYEGNKGFFCFVCNKGGDAITLVKELHNLGFRDAVNFINNK